jgi:small subunit ribosomal protein S17
MPKRVVVGVVTRDRADKTRRVELRRKVRHPLYGKYVAQRTICYVHDEDNQSHEGDTVEIVESRPLSKLKRWSLVRVLAKGTKVDVAALRAARKAEEEAEAAITAHKEKGPGTRPAAGTEESDK